jgi:hypothetical protein
MLKKKLLLVRCMAFVVACVAILSGCQTYQAGLTLPSPHYLKHYPNYFAPDPPFPLQRERDAMLDPTGEISRGATVGALPGGLPQAPASVTLPVPVGGR